MVLIVQDKIKLFRAGHRISYNIATCSANEDSDHLKKTCLYNFDPIKPHFYVVELGFTGINYFFLFQLKKHILWVLAEAVLTSIHNFCFEQKYEKYQSFLSANFQFLKVKFSIYLNRRVFVMSVCASAQSVQSLVSAWRHVGSLATHRVPECAG